MTLNRFSTLSLPILLVFISLQLFVCTGAIEISDSSKILGGTEAPDKSFPFQVYLEIPEPLVPKTVSKCSGTLIKHSDHRYKILTAANCFDSILENNQTSDKHLLITVIMGANDIVAHRQRGKVLQIKYASVKIHAHYNIPMNSRANDIAIIPLPVDFKPVSGLYDSCGLAPSGDHKHGKEIEVKVAGWGNVDAQGQDSNKLLFIKTKILPDDACEKARVASGTPAIYNKHFLCTDGTGDKGTCHGDSGAPLITAGNPSVVLGIASYRLTNICEGSTPSYFTRVASYLEWIAKTI